MQKVIVISFLTIHLFCNTEFGQLGKLPKLFFHYHQHKKTIPSLSFVSFIAMHYGGNNGITPDNKQKDQLPFHHMTHPIITFAVLHQQVASFKSFFAFSSKTTHFPYKTGNAFTLYQKSVFRPPILLV